jgi:Flp pilus assembly protein CpaB
MRRPTAALAALFLAAGFGPLARAADRPETVTVLVARQDIAAFTVIKEPQKYFKQVRYVRGDEPKGALTRFEQVKDKVVSRPLAEDQPLKEKDLTAALPPALNVPKGMRAVAIKIAPDNANGFVLPGVRVDVCWVRPRGKGKNEASVLVKDVLVLAVDVETRPEARQTATLAVTVEQARQLAAAAQEGSFRVALRPPQDE